MKKVILLTGLFLAVNFLNAQNSGDREKRLALFVHEANLIKSSTTDVTQQENRIVRLAGNFLAEYRSKDEVKNMEDIENNLLSCHQCDPVKIKKYLALISDRNGKPAMFPSKLLIALGPRKMIKNYQLLSKFMKTLVHET